jgi:hypothetical protein
MMHRNAEGKLYVDTAFMNAVQAKLPKGCEIHHMGWGEGYLATPVGRVEFDRMRGVAFEGCSGRPHLVYGDAPAIELMLAHADGC